MSEHLASAPPVDASAPPVDEPGTEPGTDCAAAVADITSVMANTRQITLVCGGLLTADIAGLAIAESALLRHGHGVAWVCSALLVPVILSWLSAALRVVLAERSVTVALSALRYTAGAPADPSAPWHPLGVRQLADAELAQAHVAPLIGAAAVRHTRARAALSSAVIATAGFLLWAALSLAITAG